MHRTSIRISACLALCLSVGMAAVTGCNSARKVSEGPMSTQVPMAAVSVKSIPPVDGCAAQAKLAASSWVVVGETIQVPNPKREPDAPDRLLSPYTADQIREACADGMVMGVCAEEKNKPAGMIVTKFSNGTATNVTYRHEAYRDGVAPAAPRDTPTKWEDLRRHASFPADITTVAWTLTKGPLGERPCWMYRQLLPIKQGADGADLPQQVIVFFMAEDLPGPPIRWEVWQGGERIAAYTQVTREVVKGK